MHPENIPDIIPLTHYIIKAEIFPFKNLAHYVECRFSTFPGIIMVFVQPESGRPNFLAVIRFDHDIGEFTEKARAYSRPASGREKGFDCYAKGFFRGMD